MFSKLLKSTFFIFTLFVGTGILANAARTGPKEAVDNWGAWVRFLGMDTVPNWMKTSTFQWVVIVVAALVVIVSVVGIVLRFQRQPIGAPLVPLVSRSHFITLREAATLTYETFRAIQSLYSDAADQLSKDDPLGWCASFLILKGLPIYGRHPPSRQRELIPAKELNRLHVENDVTELHEIFSPKNPIWTDLQVLLDELNPLLEHIKKDYRE